MGYGVAWIDKFANAFVSENVVHGYDVVTPRPFVKSAYQKNNFLISQQKKYVVGTQKNRLNETFF